MHGKVGLFFSVFSVIVSGFTVGCSTSGALLDESDESSEEGSDGDLTAVFSGRDGSFDSDPLPHLDIPSNDTCLTPGVISVEPGISSTKTGTLAGALDQPEYSTFCVEQAEEDVVREVFYRIDVAEQCTAGIKLEGPNGFDGVLSFRSGDCEVDEYCSDTKNEAEFHQLDLPSGSYYLMVSGHSTELDEFSITVDCAYPVCGDGIVNDGLEDCDDGNNLPFDGCDATCNLEFSPVSIDTCGGAEQADPLFIGPGDVRRIPEEGVASTLGGSDSGTGGCMLTPDDNNIFAAPDHVYRVQPTSSGMMTLTLGVDGDDQPLCGGDEPEFPYPTGCWDRALHVRAVSCSDPAAQVACSDDAEAWWTTEQVQIAVEAGTDYYVFVDGYNDDPWGAGQYQLRVELTAN